MSGLEINEFSLFSSVLIVSQPEISTKSNCVVFIVKGKVITVLQLTSVAAVKYRVTNN
jgi:hypothetical protein